MMTLTKFSTTVAAAWIMVAPAAAAADDGSTAQQEPAPQQETGPARPAWPDGLYFLLDFDLGDSANPETSADFGADLDWSAGIGLGVGYRFAGRLRLEGEIHSNFFSVGSLDLGPATPFPQDNYAGGMWAQGAMANLVYELPPAGPMRPYIGAGYGFSRVTARYKDSVCVLFCFSTKGTVVNDWDYATAWQAMAGVSFARRTSATEVFFSYRYFETDELKFRTESGTSFTQEGLRNHTLSVGIRFPI